MMTEEQSDELIGSFEVPLRSSEKTHVGPLMVEKCKTCLDVMILTGAD